DSRSFGFGNHASGLHAFHTRSGAKGRGEARGNGFGPKWTRACEPCRYGTSGKGLDQLGLEIRPSGFEPLAFGSGDQRSIRAELRARSLVVTHFEVRLQRGSERPRQTTRLRSIQEVFSWTCIRSAKRSAVTSSCARSAIGSTDRAVRATAS